MPRIRSETPEQNSRYYKAYYAKKSALINAAKAKPCADCGVEYPSYVMDFDHLGEKEFNVARGRTSRSFVAVQSEIEKCDVVCANCHRIRTWARFAV